MTPIQSLIDQQRCNHLARATDPDTSHEAAALAVQFITRQQALIVDALKAGPAGKDEIARRARLAGVAVARRLPDLQSLGVVVTTGNKVLSDSGRSEREWALA